MVISSVRPVTSFIKNTRFGYSVIKRNIQTSPNRLSEAKNELVLTFASSNKAFYKDITVKQVDFFTTAGACGVVAQHVPLLGCLKSSMVTVTESDDSVKKFLVSGGVVSILPDSSIQILVEEAGLPEDFDMERISAGISKYSSAKGDGDDALDKQMALEVYNFLDSSLKSV